MKILYVLTSAAFGGVSRHVIALATHVHGQGHDVAVLAGPEPRLVRTLRAAGVRVIVNPHFVQPISPARDLRATAAVVAALRAEKPDLVSAHSTKAGLAARLAAALLRHPRVIFTAHGWKFIAGQPSIGGRVSAATERLAARASARIVCVAEADRRLALEYHVGRPEQFVVIHNGIDPRAFPGADGARVRKELDLGDLPVIASVGRLAEQKDPHTLLAACGALRDDVRLLLVGDGPLRADVERIVSSNERLAGRVLVLGEREDVPDILAAADVFLLTSRWEGLSRAVIEAMLSGLPVVATDVGGTAELVQEGVTGTLVRPGDASAIVRALDGLVADSARRRRWGAAGRARALGGFTIDAMFDATTRLYHEVLANGAVMPCRT
jgi:glycosyltransferase involved in cell wall biosynthesis